MTGLAPEADAALEPVRAALRTAAERAAAGLRDDAGRRASEILAAAQAEAAAARDAAAREGEAAARREAALQSARVRRQAQEFVLAQRSALRAELQRRVREAAALLTADIRYGGLMVWLADQCAVLLGPDATVTESPDGGVIAEAGSRRLDLSLPELAGLTLESLPGGEPWTR